MRRFLHKIRIAFLLFFCAFSLHSFSQGVTGIWRGYFVASDGYQYRLEFQVKQNSDAVVSVKGVSYSWQDDKRFYGKATMTGSYMKASQNFRIREIRTVELQNPGGATCIMNYDLHYIKSGKEEFLEGTYLGKYEEKDEKLAALREWGDCGAGRVYLRKVPTTDFYVEPFLKNNKAIAPPVVKKTTTTTPPVTKKVVPKATPPVTKTPPPVAKKVVPKTTPPVVKKTVPPAITPEKKTTTITKVVDSSTVVKPTIKNNTAKIDLPTPSVLKTRQNELMKSLVISNPNVTIKIYDNGEIDDDSISVYLDKKLVLSNKRLTASALTIKLTMDEDNPDHELVLVAENLGRIPPNTSLMIVEAGDQRFDVRITSTEQKNAVVRFKYQKTP